LKTYIIYEERYMILKQTYYTINKRILLLLIYYT